MLQEVWNSNPHASFQFRPVELPILFCRAYQLDYIEKDTPLILHQVVGSLFVRAEPSWPLSYLAFFKAQALPEHGQGFLDKHDRVLTWNRVESRFGPVFPSHKCGWARQL